MSRIVFLDIDGTLYSEEIGVPQSAKDAIKQLKENGDKVVFCTGRANSFVPPDYLKMGIDGLIYGAGTYVEYEGKILKQLVMTNQELDALLQWTKENKVQLVLEGMHAGYYDSSIEDSYYKQMKKWLKDNMNVTLEPFDKAKDILKWTFHNITKPQVDELSEILHGKYYGIFHSETGYSEFLPVGISKKSGICEVLDYTKIPWENTYAFGDSMNDYDMIQYVKYGVAMGNAVPELKEIAKYKTDTVEKDGIYNGLKRFGLI